MKSIWIMIFASVSPRPQQKLIKKKSSHLDPVSTISILSLWHHIILFRSLYVSKGLDLFVIHKELDFVHNIPARQSLKLAQELSLSIILLVRRSQLGAFCELRDVCKRS